MRISDWSSDVCSSDLPSDLVWAELAAEDLGIVGYFRPRHLLDHLQQVELVGRILLAAHHQNVLEALVILAAVQGLAVAHAVELEVLQRLDDLRRVEGDGHLAGVGVDRQSTRLNSSHYCASRM